MNQIPPEQRGRRRTPACTDIELVAGEARIPAELVNISFGGIMGRVAPGAIEHQKQNVGAVRLEDLPELAIRVVWAANDLFGAEFTDPQRAGRVVAGFLELFVPPRA